MGIQYLHTMVRVSDLDKSMAFYRLLGLEETRRHDSEKGRFTLVYMAPPGQPECPVELTHNWDGDAGLPADSRHFGHLAFAVDDIHATCAHLAANRRRHLFDQFHIRCRYRKMPVKIFSSNQR